MTEKTMTLVDVSPPGAGEPPEEMPPLTAAEQETVRELVRQARASGTALTGPGWAAEAADQDGRRGRAR